MNRRSKPGAVVRVICCGDVVGRPGRAAIARAIPLLRERFSPALIIVNGENSAGGLGIDSQCAKELRDAGVDVITLGDHTWNRKEFRDVLAKNPEWCIRPDNFPAGAPGQGWTIVGRTVDGEKVKIGVMNVMGRVFISGSLDCPFRAADRILKDHLAECRIVICETHAEATSEKVAMGTYLDGRVSLVVGTHTHIQTADEKILEKGTGYITDLGMSGNQNGVIGMDRETALGRFITGLPAGYKVAEGDGEVCGVCCSIDPDSGKALSIERFRV